MPGFQQDAAAQDTATCLSPTQCALQPSPQEQRVNRTSSAAVLIRLLSPPSVWFNCGRCSDAKLGELWGEKDLFCGLFIRVLMEECWLQGSHDLSGHEQVFLGTLQQPPFASAVQCAVVHLEPVLPHPQSCVPPSPSQPMLQQRRTQSSPGAMQCNAMQCNGDFASLLLCATLALQLGG